MYVGGCCQHDPLPLFQMNYLMDRRMIKNRVLFSYDDGNLYNVLPLAFKALVLNSYHRKYVLLSSVNIHRISKMISRIGACTVYCTSLISFEASSLPLCRFKSAWLFFKVVN